MISFISKLFLPKYFKSYHNLSDNLVESDNYEIRKIIDGPIDGALFIKDSKMILVQSRDYLWKINEHGQIVDSMKKQGAMHSSGLCLKDEGYIDWVHTGDKTEKKYSEVIDATEMTEEELNQYLQGADIVEFNHIKDHRRHWFDACFLKSGDRITILKFSENSERVDVNCDSPGVIKGEYEEIGWYKTSLEGYEKNYNDNLIVLERQSMEICSDDSSAVTFQTFVRDFYEFEEGFPMWLFGHILGRTILASLPGSPPSSYWFGEGYFQLTHNSEKFNFKAFTCNEDKPVDFHNFVTYKLPEKYFNDIAIIGISYRRNSYIKNEKLNKYYEKDIGLYVIRKKTKPD